MTALPRVVPGILAILIAAVLWGSIGTTQALLPPDRQPLVVAAMRLLIGALTLIGLAVLRREWTAGLRSIPVGWTLIAAGAMALYNAMFFFAVSKIGVGIGTALAIGSAPIWVSLIEYLTARRVPGLHMVIGQCVCIVGATLLVVSGVALTEGTGGSVRGYVLAAIAGSAYATYSLSTAKAGSDTPPTVLAAATFSVAALVLAPVLFILPTAWIASGQTIAGLLYLGVIATGISYMLFTWGLRHVPASAAVTLSLVEPLTAWLLATLVVGEPLSGFKITGAAILFIGLWLVTTALARPAQATCATPVRPAQGRRSDRR